ncbi:MAG: hypothetical protein N2038_13520 [Geminicoccaceae bacterium]|nr:hypothetical protein [Geminicoccaceae bacterium]
MNEVHDRGITAGIEGAGDRPPRVDREEYDDRIVAEIQCSLLLAADFTHG